MAEGEYSATQFFIVFIAVIFAAEGSVQMIAYSTSKFPSASYGFVFSHLPGLTKAQAGANHILWLRSQKPRIGEHDHTSEAFVGEKLLDDSSRFELEKVEFAYSSRPNNTIIKGLDIDVSFSCHHMQGVLSDPYKDQAW